MQVADFILIRAGSGGLAEGIPAREEPRMGKMVSTGARWKIATTGETQGSRATRTIPWCCLRHTSLCPAHWAIALSHIRTITGDSVFRNYQWMEFNPVLSPDPGVGRSLTQEGTNDGWEAARLCLAFGEPPEGKDQ